MKVMHSNRLNSQKPQHRTRMPVKLETGLELTQQQQQQQKLASIACKSDLSENWYKHCLDT
jgi:hypothetical protein